MRIERRIFPAEHVIHGEPQWSASGKVDMIAHALDCRPGETILDIEWIIEGPMLAVTVAMDD